jgi:sporulation protein YlmC with PRC-barrel domain
MDLNFRKNASVITADGQRVGHIDRVVIDPKTKRVTQIVIRHGLFFPDDRIAPIQMVEEATEETIRLREHLGELQALPKFEQKDYVTVDDSSDQDATEPFAQPLYWYPGVATGLPGTPEAATLADPGQTPGTIALREGAKVTDENGKDVGRVELVLMDSGSKQATHILITKGLLSKERKLIPTFWVRDFADDEIHLAAPASVLEKLQPYEN